MGGVLSSYRPSASELYCEWFSLVSSCSCSVCIHCEGLSLMYSDSSVCKCTKRQERDGEGAFGRGEPNRYCLVYTLL